MIRRKNTITILFLFSCLIIWVLWSTNKEVNNTIAVVTKNKYFIRNAMITPSNKFCQSQETPFLIILVTSYVGHVELRSAHRRAMPTDVLKSMNASRIFLLAQIPANEKSISQEAIKDESSTFEDILQGAFLENYRNLTHKHLMGLEWASTMECKPSYVLKVDDDTVFNLNKTYELLKQLHNNFHRNDVLMGYMLNNTKPRRMKQNKWYVTWEEYPRNIYPPYLSGWYYIITQDVAAKICEEALYHSYFWIDDIFVTGILVESLNIKLQQLPDDFWLEYYELLECCLTDMIDKSVRCDFVVGPNGNRNNLIVEFSEAINNCDKWKNCTQRPIEKPLKRTCVTNIERNIFSDGQAEVRYMKLS